MTLAGADSQSTTCSSGAYSFVVNKTSDGTYTLTVSQADVAGNISLESSVTWTRDASTPAAPTVSSPVAGTTTNNASTLTITGSSGSCVVGGTVSLTGPATASSTACSSGGYAFTLSAGTDASRTYTLTQTNTLGTASSGVTRTWVRDTAAPSTPLIAAPASVTISNGASSLTITGGTSSCETGATVTLSGDDSQSVGCSGGTYGFTISKSTDSTYTFSVIQVDVAGNASGAATRTWIRDTGAPSAPVVGSPSTNPYYSSDTSLTLTGSCDSGSTITLSGAYTNSTSCTSGLYSFTLTNSGGTKNYTLTQVDPAGNSSSGVARQWTQDSTAPTAPVVSAPASSPYYGTSTSFTVSGTCETGASITLTGDSTASASCTSGSYSFTITKTTDLTYNFTITQSDPAGNTSGGSSVEWILDRVAPSAVAITSPATATITNNNSSFTISGDGPSSCETGATISLTGDDSQQAACTDGSYSFTISKTSDDTYNFTLTQTDAVGNVSGASTRTWTRNAAIPSTPGISQPVASTTTHGSSDFTISGNGPSSCDTGATVTLSGADSQSTPCSGGAYSFTISKVLDNTYNFTITQIVSGVSSGEAVRTWVRDTSAPSAPVVSAPASNPYYSAGTSLTLSGTCEAGASITLTGDSSQGAECTSGSYSFTITKSTDQTYNFTITQQDPAGNTSGSSSVEWILDRVAPSAVAISNPASATITSSDDSITISG